MKSISIALIVKLLSTLIKNISPDIKAYIAKVITDLEQKAKSTANPFDDLLVELLKLVLL